MLTSLTAQPLPGCSGSHFPELLLLVEKHAFRSVFLSGRHGHHYPQLGVCNTAHVGLTVGSLELTLHSSQAYMLGLYAWLLSGSLDFSCSSRVPAFTVPCPSWKMPCFKTVLPSHCLYLVFCLARPNEGHSCI